MALRADTARHIITGATVLIFSAAAIGTAMRYQGAGSMRPAGQDAELTADAASTSALTGAPSPMRYIDGARGIGSDMGIQLDGTMAAGGSATLWPFRDGGPGASMGTVGWWGNTQARLTPTSRGGGGGGAGMLGGPGSGYAVSGGPRDKPAAAGGPKPKASGGSGGKGSGGGSSGGSASSGPIFEDHSPSVGDLVDAAIDGDLIGALPGGIGGLGGDLSHTPEPASLLLMVTGVAGVIAVRRRHAHRR